MLEDQGAGPFRVNAYRRAAATIEQMMMGSINQPPDFTISNMRRRRLPRHSAL